MNLEQMIETVLTNWAAASALASAVIAIVLVLIARIRSGDWRGTLRLILRLVNAVQELREPKRGTLTPRITPGDNGNGKRNG